MDKPSHWVTFLNYIFNPMAGFVHILPKNGLKQPSIFLESNERSFHTRNDAIWNDASTSLFITSVCYLDIKKKKIYYWLSMFFFFFIYI